MKKLLSIAAILLTIFVFVLQFYSFQSVPQYKNVPAPNIVADSSKSLIMQLIAREELFMGSIDFRMTDVLDRIAEIRMVNESTGDDSITGMEYLITVQEKDGQWHIIDYKTRWKCRDIFFESWTINTCI